MRKKLIIVALTGFIAGLNVSYAQPTMDFAASTYDFGEISEGMVAKHEFVFKNNGDQPLVLTSVKASCGCTTPSWTKEPILPGNTGQITASYNSKNRPGGFNKSITITSNAIPASKVIYIKGTTVKPLELEPLFTAEELRNAAQVKVEQPHLQLGKVQMGSSKSVKIEVQNQGKSLLMIKGIYSNCRCLSIMPDSPLEVLPGKTISLELVFTAKAAGVFTYGAHLLTNDLVQPKLQTYFTAEIVPQPDESSVVKEAPSKISF
jgi:hypothetical protein